MHIGEVSSLANALETELSPGTFENSSALLDVGTCCDDVRCEITSSERRQLRSSLMDPENLQLLKVQMQDILTGGDMLHHT